MAACTRVKKIQPQGMRYKVVTHDDVTEMVRPLFLEHGVLCHLEDLTATQADQRTEVRVVVRFVNIDEPADSISVPALGYGIDNSDKGPGKAVSYACKYALLKTLMLETGEDSDLADLPHKTVPAKKAEPKAAPQRASKAQVDKILAGWAQLGLTADERFAALDKAGVPTLDELPEKTAAAWITRIDSKLSKTKEV